MSQAFDFLAHVAMFFVFIGFLLKILDFLWTLGKAAIDGLSTIEIESGTASYASSTRADDNRPRIGNVVKNGSSITIFDEDGRRRATFSCMSHATVTGFTSNAIHVRTGNDICIYNAEGKPGRNYNV